MPQKDAESFKFVTGATLRAIAGQKDLDAVFAAGEAPIGRITSTTKPRLPSPDRDMSDESITLIRGCADAHALHIAHHDARTHYRQVPKDRDAAAAFTALEQARCEALGFKELPGAGQNLNAVLNERCKRAGFENIQSRTQTDLGEALHVLARVNLTGEPVPSSAKKLVDLWQPWLDGKMKNLGFKNLSALLHDQEAYGRLARQLIEALEMEVGEEIPEEDLNDDPLEGAQEEEQEAAEEDGSEDQGTEDGASDMQDGEGGDTTEGEHDPDAASEYTDDMMSDGASELASSYPQNRPDGLMSGPGGQYLIYTTQFDEEIEAQELADFEELNRLRSMLDRQLAHNQTIITKLANRLQRKVMSRQQRNWRFDVEEGILNGARLARAIANPNVRLTFKMEEDMPFRDTVVSILIDNSGSMRGRPIAIAAMTADIISRTLERCNVKTEVLGFTTRAWKGGQSRELWVDNGKPEKPGRLNDLRHVIYKAADAPIRRTRRNIGLMLKEGLLKENIDGEALVWAYNRLARRPEQRKIMIVISDGAPVDDSTLSANPANILELDLRNVIQWIEQSSNIEIAAIGIGHDVTRYYKRAITIADADELASALVNELEDLFEKKR